MDKKVSFGNNQEELPSWSQNSKSSFLHFYPQVSSESYGKLSGILMTQTKMFNKINKEMQ